MDDLLFGLALAASIVLCALAAGSFFGLSHPINPKED